MARKPVPLDENKDLGFGSVVTKESSARFLNRDGSFNVERHGLGFWESLSPYHELITVPWTKFIAILVSSYVVLNCIFATLFVLCGEGAIQSAEEVALDKGPLRAFFFSVETFATIGYGHIYPVTLAANVVLTVESLVGLLWVAFSTGLLFARFSRPTAKILYSEKAVVAPYRGISGLMFRVANARRTQIVDISARLTLGRFETVNGARVRRFYNLPLERDSVVFFPLSWTVVHPIDESSPLHGVSEQDFSDSDAEVLILLTGTDETFSQVVHSRSSYKASEISWGAKFASVFNPTAPGERLSVDLTKLSQAEPAKLPDAPVPTGGTGT